MKKVLMSLVLLVSVASVITLNSCIKANTESTDPITTTAKITGNVTAEFDITNATEEKVVGNPPCYIIATYDADELVDNPNPNYNYGKREIIVPVTSNGDYSMSIPCGTKTVNVSLRTTEFAYEQITSATTKVRKVYSYQHPGVISVVKDDIKVLDIKVN